MNDEGQWNHDLVNSMFPPDVASGIIKITLPHYVMFIDVPCWKGSTNGNFSTAAAYELIDDFSSNRSI